MPDLHFPPGFVWGSATAAIQIEGAAREDGKGLSVWDVFCERHPERIHERGTPEVACDHYHRWAEDVRWMKELGHNGYRMSISWPRVLPDGRGAPNPKGLAFYDRLFDALLEAGVQPNVTLYHWDLPVALGGWEHPETVDAYLEYARLCFERFGDRVKLWATLNEPGWTTLNGYVTGVHPPGLHDYRTAVQVGHHFMVAHARAVGLYHEICGRPEPGEGIGIALNLSHVYPATDRGEDVAAARIADGVLNRFFIDPVLRGEYPQDVMELYDRCGIRPPGEADFGRDTVDWVGVNYYYPHYATADAPGTEFHLPTAGNPQETSKFSIEGLFRFVQNPRGRYTDWNWEIDPDGLYELLLRAQEYRPGIPVYITENGIGLQDRLVDGVVDDPDRIAFVTEHLQAAHRALQEGVNLRGYYMWALMDNFSWVNGYKKRYGFLYVDRETQDRTPKRSAAWFRELAATGVLRV